jgi:transcription elongation GreA/GreB family factor
MDKNGLKSGLLNLCQVNIDERLDSLKSIINDLQQSLQSETKSSAGDKHETGRAMVQLEREKAGQQLAEIQKTQQILAKINPEVKSDVIGLGSVVFTTGSNYFIGISAGELKINNQIFYAISPSTPIGVLLLGKKVGDTINFRTNTFVVTDIV